MGIINGQRQMRGAGDAGKRRHRPVRFAKSREAHYGAREKLTLLI